MLSKLTLGALSGGGIERIAVSAASEIANVAASRPKVAGRPNAAMHRPASAGPAIAALVPLSDVSADTAVSSSGATSFGVNDSSAGTWMPPIADMSAATTNRNIT